MSRIDKTRSVADIKDLMRDSHEAQGNLCHWFIEFSVRIPDLTVEDRKELGIPVTEGEDPELISPWATDEISIQGSLDAMDAVRWVMEYANDPEQYGMPITGFRLNGVQLLSEAEFAI